MIKEAAAFIQDSLLSWLQRRCAHPSNMVAVDILEGCVDGLRVKYCRRCGSVQTLWQPQPKPGRPSKFAILDDYWRRPDPHLYRGL